MIYRGETKRALLPNEITSLDTVKALFVRSFGKQLTMEYMDTPRVNIYIHDSNKDIFYELENLSEIKDRTVLKLFEADSSGRGPCGLGPSGMPPITNSDELTPLPAAAIVPGTTTTPVPTITGQPICEPEYVDSWHVKAMKALNRAQKESDLVGVAPPARGASSTLPRPITSNVATEPSGARVGLLGERSKTLGPGFLRGHRFINGGVLPGQQGMGGRVESGYVSSPDGNFEFETSLGRVLPISGRFSSGMSEPKYYRGPESTEEAKERMMHMEAQLSQLTGMVEKALKNKKLGKKTVSFDKAVTYSDDSPPQPTSILMNSAKRQQQVVIQQVVQQHQAVPVVPQHHHHHQHNHLYHSNEEPNLMMDPGLYNHLRGLQRSARDLRQEVKVLRRLTQLQSMAMKDLVQDTYLKLREACIAFAMSQTGALSGNAFDLEMWRVAQDEEIYQKELNELVRSISHLEAKVEETRSGVINKKNKIHLADVENMALVLSKSSRTVTQLKRAFPTLEANLRSSTAFQQQQQLQQQKGDGSTAVATNTSILVTEDFLRRTPERLDNVWRRCKKLTGTLVTLKRLASVQEQRIHPGTSVDVHHVSLSPTPSEMNRLPPAAITSGCEHGSGKESTLDDLLDALQNYSGSGNPPPPPQQQHYHHHHQQQQQLPSASISAVDKLKQQPDNTQGPTTSSPMKRQLPPQAAASLPTNLNPVPNEKQAVGHAELASAVMNGMDEPDSKPSNPVVPPCPAERKSTAILKGAPPPPPPRTSSNKTAHCESLDSGQTKSLDISDVSDEGHNNLRKSNSVTGPPVPLKPTDISSLTAKSRQDLLEVRHQELLQRQKQLQEQYQRLQEMQQKKSAATIVANSSVASTMQQQAISLQHQQQLLQQQNLLEQMKNETAKEAEKLNQKLMEETVLAELSVVEDSKEVESDNPANPDEKNCLGDDFPFADSSLKDGGDTSSDSTSTNEPSADSKDAKPEEEEVLSSVAPEVAPPPPPPDVVAVVVVPQKSANGKIPPEVPARKSKEGNNCNTKVYHSEII